MKQPESSVISHLQANHLIYLFSNHLLDHSFIFQDAYALDPHSQPFVAGICSASLPFVLTTEYRQSISNSHPIPIVDASGESQDAQFIDPIISLQEERRQRDQKVSRGRLKASGWLGATDEIEHE